MEKKIGVKGTLPFWFKNFDKIIKLLVLTIIILAIAIFSLKPMKSDNSKLDSDKSKWVVDTICKDSKYYVIIGHSLENENLGFKIVDTIIPTYHQNDTITKF